MVDNSVTIAKQGKPNPDYKKLKRILAARSGEKVSLEQAQKIGEFLLRVHAIINQPELD